MSDQPRYYSGARARRSLGHFLAGKGMSALLGLGLLVLMARQLEVEVYGRYIALLSMLEIAYLVSGLGLSTLAQRYLPEWREKAPAAQLRGFLLSLLARRALQSGAVALLALLALPPLAGLLGLALPAGALGWYAGWLLLGMLTRQFDEVFPALLLQGVTQGMQIVASAIKLAVLLLWPWSGSAADLVTLLRLECGVALLLIAIAAAMLLRHLRLHPGQLDRPPHHNPALRGVVWRLYGAQVLGQLWSGHAAKLAVTRVAGLTQTATLGFAMALVDMLRNYSPAYMLAHWVRPLMVSQWLATREVKPVATMASAVLKASWACLLPLLPLAWVLGEPLLRLLSAGRYGDGAAPLLAMLALLALAQCAHLLIGMLSATLERTAMNLWATLLGALSLPLGLLLLPSMGAAGMVLALVGGELLWCGLVLAELRRHAPGLSLHGGGLLRLAGAALLAMLLWALGRHAAGLPPALAADAGALAQLGAAAAWLLLYGLALLLLRPWRSEEVQLARRALPARWRGRGEAG